MCCPTCAAFQLFLMAELFRKRNVHYPKQHKGPPTLPADAAEGPHSHANYHWFPFWNVNLWVGYAYGSQTASFLYHSNASVAANANKVIGFTWSPSSNPCLSSGCRSTRIEADRPDPAETEPHCSGHPHSGGSQTKRRQVNCKVSALRQKKASCICCCNPYACLWWTSKKNSH